MVYKPSSSQLRDMFFLLNNTNFDFSRAESAFKYSTTLSKIVDVTIAYPNGKPLGIVDILSAWRPACTIHVHYKIFNIEQVLLLSSTTFHFYFNSIAYFQQVPNFPLLDLTPYSSTCLQNFLQTCFTYYSCSYQAIRKNFVNGCIICTSKKKKCWENFIEQELSLELELNTGQEKRSLGNLVNFCTIR